MAEEKPQKSPVVTPLIVVLTLTWLGLLASPMGWHSTRCDLRDASDIFCFYEYEVGAWQVTVTDSMQNKGASAVVGLIGRINSDADSLATKIKEVMKPPGKYWTWDMESENCAIIQVLESQRLWCRVCRRLGSASMAVMGLVSITILIFMGYLAAGLQNKKVLFVGPLPAMIGVIAYGFLTREFPDGEELSFSWAFIAAAVVSVASFAPGLAEKAPPPKADEDDAKLEMARLSNAREVKGPPEKSGMPPGMQPGMQAPGMQPPGMHGPGMQPPGMQAPGMQPPSFQHGQPPSGRGGFNMQPAMNPGMQGPGMHAPSSQRGPPSSQTPFLGPSGNGVPSWGLPSSLQGAGIQPWGFPTSGPVSPSQAPSNAGLTVHLHVQPQNQGYQAQSPGAYGGNYQQSYGPKDGFSHPFYR